MKRKRRAARKPARKKPTITENNQVGLPSSSSRNAVKKVASGKSKDENIVVPAAKSNSDADTLSVSSSSSGSHGAFNIEDIIGSDDLAIDKGVNVPAKQRGLAELAIADGVEITGRKRGRPPTKANVSNKGVDMNAVYSSPGRTTRRTIVSKKGADMSAVNSSPGRPSKRANMSKRAADTSAVNPFSGLSSLSAKKYQSNSNKLQLDPRYNQNELKASLAVIKKVMEMDEAVPFSAPVDPVAIPNYFSVIKTPMDFGAICNNLQNGLKYLNSGDVYKDVEYIWQNCQKFNKKGDYIVYLMKRVKKKFEKYWIAAGLHGEIAGKSTEPSGDDSSMHGKHEGIRDSTLVGKHVQVEKETYGISQPHSQLPQSSNSLPHQSFHPQSSQQPLFSSLQPGADDHLAGLSHLVAYIDKAIRHSRHEASFVEHSVGNPSQMQNDNFGTSRQHSQVPPSSYSLPFHDKCDASLVENSIGNPSRVQNDTFGRLHSNVHPSSYKQPQQMHQPQPSTNQLPQFSQLQADTNSNFAATSRDVTMKPKGDAARGATTQLVCGVSNSKQQRVRRRSHNMQQSQNRISPVYPQSHANDVGDSGDTDFPSPMDYGSANIEHASQRFPMDPPVTPSLFRTSQAQQISSQVNESHQHHANTWQPQPSSNFVQNAGKSYMQSGNDSHMSRTHVLETSADPGADQTPPNHSRALHISGSHNQPYESQQRVKNKKVRGLTRCRAVWELPDGERIHVPVNSLGQPVGPDASKLASFLGTVARNGKMCPLSIPDWHAMPDEKKEEMWLFVQSKFDLDEICRIWVLKSIANKWRNFKARLKAEHYYPYKTDEERLVLRDKRVLPDQWPVLVSFWNSEELQLRCEKNRANRANQKVYHTTGSKSFARLREEERAKRSDGREPTRADLFVMTRTRKDGQPVNEEAAEIISKLNEQSAQRKETSQTSNDYEDTFIQVMGPEKCGQIRCFGLGPTPSELWGRKRGQLQMMRVASEAKKAANEEVSKMLVKMEAMEEKYSSMEAQIAKMTSSMQNFLEKMAGPSKTAGAEQRQEQSSSSHAISSNEVDSAAA